MRKWKKFMAIGLAASMIIPSGVPQQILWASEFSAESSETVADVFGDNSESESGNRILVTSHGWSIYMKTMSVTVKLGMQ